jgi:hypothetical protein
VAPLLLRRGWPILRSLWSPPARSRPLRPPSRFKPYRLALACILVAYHLCIALLFPPLNLFHGLRLNVPPSILRLRLAQLYASQTGQLSGQNFKIPLEELADQLPDHLLALLARLSTLDNRLLYVRFGHRALHDCEICTGRNDYLLYSLPLLVGKHVAFLASVGLLTAGDGRGQWRSWLVVASIAGAAAEAWARADEWGDSVMVRSSLSQRLLCIV